MFNEGISLLIILWTSLNSWLTPSFLFLLLNLMIGTIFITSAFTSSKPQLHHHQHQQQEHGLTRAPTILERLKSVKFYSYCSHTHVDQPTQLHHNVTLQQQFQNLPSEPGNFPEQAAYHHQHQHQEHTLTRAPTILERLKSINFYSYGSHNDIQVDQPTQLHNAALQQQFQNLPYEPDYFPEPAAFELQQGKHPLETEPQTLPIDEAPTLEEIYNKIKSTSSLHYNRQNSDTKPIGGEIPVRLPAKIKKSASHKSAFNHFQTVHNLGNVATTKTGGGTEVDEKADDFINRFKKQLQLQRIESILRYKKTITKGRGM